MFAETRATDINNQMCITIVCTQIVLDILCFNKIYASRGCGMKQAYQKSFRLASFWGKVGWKDLLSDNERSSVRSPIRHLVYWAEALLRLNWWQIANISDLLPFLICCQIVALAFYEWELEYKHN